MNQSPIRIVTVKQIASAARGLLEVVDDRRIRGAAIQAELPLYERAAELIDLLDAVDSDFDDTIPLDQPMPEWAADDTVGV